jgi:hypothetical protein
MPGHDDEKSLALVTTKTSFEAEVIAAALRDRGVNARVLPEGQLPSGGFGVGTGPGVGARVMVLESEESGARAALEDIKAESAKLDWDNVETGDAELERSRALGKHKRFVMTAGILFVPVGLAVLGYGTVFDNPMVRMVGGTVVACAAIMVGYAVFSRHD